MELTYQQAYDLLNKAVADKGADYIYPDEEKAVYGPYRDKPMCSYYAEQQSVDGETFYTPSCIVGHVIDYLGLREQFLAVRTVAEGESAQKVLSGLGVDMTPMAASLLANAQTSQDEGWTWGDAVAEAVTAALHARPEDFE